MDILHLDSQQENGRKSETDRARGEGAEIKQKKRRYCQEDEMEKRKEWKVMKRMV